MSNPSQVISEEFHDIEDNAFNTSDLTQTCKIVNEICCGEVKTPYAKERKTPSRSVLISNEPCETTLLKRKRTSLECTINKKIVRDFVRNRNIMYSEREKMNETLDGASEKDDNFASEKLGDGNHGFEEYKERKETQKNVKKLKSVEEQSEGQPEKFRRRNFKELEKREDENADGANSEVEEKVRDLEKQLEQNRKKNCTKKEDGGKDKNSEAQFENNVEGREEEKSDNCEEECKEKCCEAILDEWEGGEGVDEGDDEEDQDFGSEEENEVEEDLLVEEGEYENSSEEEDDEDDEEQVLTYGKFFQKTLIVLVHRSGCLFDVNP